MPKNPHDVTDDVDSSGTINRTKIVAYAAIAVALITGGLLMPMPYSGRIPAAIGNMAHGPLFALMTIALLMLWNHWAGSRRNAPAAMHSSVRRLVAVALFLFLFGVAIELVQAKFGRTPSIHDAISNGMGILAGLCVTVANARRKHARGRSTARCLWATAGVLIACVWWQPVSTLQDVWAMRTNFPLLGSFETQAELERWYFNRCEGQLSSRDATHLRRSLEVHFPVSEHPTATMVELISDWTAAEGLECDVTLDADHPEPTAEIWIQVIDAGKADDYHDVLRKPFIIHRGETAHLVVTHDELTQINAGRALDLKNIQFVDLQLRNPPCPTVVRVDFLRLRM
ncbi:VanZ like family protein [Rubripirellula lacrimiformis]|uniref:VanZ like family protein n=1 Tax=Rubripirellula lacrimiformis TaxID=1930273 RepID=A0A517N8U5_9BACT|nr:VanZ family protein [Rubripirellula lacrimiformis]QDT03565.1 VanZ like family protein [Rubripirellula lacrimiformis]